MAKPNLFLIGAPKAGTTSVHQYLGQHPEVYSCEPKEPSYFIRDTFGGACEFMVKVRTLSDYEALFDPGAGVKYRLDGSVWHLSNPQAVTEISQLYPDAKILAILRHPAERAYSDFNHRLRTETSLTTSFEKEVAELNGRYPQADTPEHYLFFFSDYARQIKRWKAAFPESQIRIDLYEDLSSDSAAYVESIFSWLGLDHTGIQIDQQKANVGRIPAYAALNEARRKKTPLFRIATIVTPRIFKDFYLKNMRGKKIKPPPMNPRTRTALAAHFTPMIKELEVLIDRDLSHWLNDSRGER